MLSQSRGPDGPLVVRDICKAYSTRIEVVTLSEKASATSRPHQVRPNKITYQGGAGIFGVRHYQLHARRVGGPREGPDGLQQHILVRQEGAGERKADKGKEGGGGIT